MRRYRRAVECFVVNEHFLPLFASFGFFFPLFFSVFSHSCPAGSRRAEDFDGSFRQQMTNKVLFGRLMKIGKKSAHAHPVYSWHRPSSRKVKRACPGKVERQRETEGERQGQTD